MWSLDLLKKIKSHICKNQKHPPRDIVQWDTETIYIGKTKLLSIIRGMEHMHLSNFIQKSEVKYHVIQICIACY